MIHFELNFSNEQSPTILCIGAHSDDIEIGTLGTLWDLSRKCPNAQVVWFVATAIDKRADEARASAEYCGKWFAASEIVMHSFRDGHLPSVVSDLKVEFENLKSSVSPSLILTHYGKDAHQDHRTISELTWQTFRDHLVLEYEIPKYDGDLGNPNVYFQLSEESVEQKLNVLARFFDSQNAKRWFSPELFKSLMRLRGMECNADSGYAEAFYGRKIVF